MEGLKRNLLWSAWAYWSDLPLCVGEPTICWVSDDASAPIPDLRSMPIESRGRAESSPFRNLFGRYQRISAIGVF